MQLDTFIEKFSAQFEEIEIDNISKDVNYKLLDTWDSLTSMSVTVMIEDEFNVTLTIEEINSPNSVEELFKLVISKQS